MSRNVISPAQMSLENIRIEVDEQQVSGLLLRPEGARALYLFAHGAGAGMTHRTMESNAQGLAEREVTKTRSLESTTTPQPKP